MESLARTLIRPQVRLGTKLAYGQLRGRNRPGLPDLRPYLRPGVRLERGRERGEFASRVEEFTLGDVDLDDELLGGRIGYGSPELSEEAVYDSETNTFSEMLGQEHRTRLCAFVVDLNDGWLLAEDRTPSLSPPNFFRLLSQLINQQIENSRAWLDGNVVERDHESPFDFIANVDGVIDVDLSVVRSNPGTEFFREWMEEINSREVTIKAASSDEADLTIREPDDEKASDNVLTQGLILARRHPGSTPIRMTGFVGGVVAEYDGRRSSSTLYEWLEEDRLFIENEPSQRPRRYDEMRKRLQRAIATGILSAWLS